MRLVSLSRSEGYDFPPDTFDVRGWEVRTALDREHVGKVDDVLIDDTGRPRYLDVDVGLFKKHVLVPLAQARVDGSDDLIWVDGLARDQFDRVPEYKHDPRVVSSDYEARLGEIYRGATLDTTEPDARLYGDADTVGVRRLARLDELDDYRVAKGDTDPRGWDVVTGDGYRIGKVSELIVDVSTMEARYLDTDIDEKKLELERVDRHILVPVDAARLDRGKKHVVVDSLFTKDLGTVPVYSGLPLTADTEDQIRSAYRVGARSPIRTDAAVTENVVERPRDDEVRAVDRFYGSRRDRSQIVAEGETATVSNAGQEVRIRLSGDDIIIERRPRD